MIVAKDEKGGIGLNNKLPWRIKEDMKRFVTLTRGNGKNAVIMGRNTWESLPNKPLIDRHNLILSKSSFEYSETACFHYVDSQTSVFKDLTTLIEYVNSKMFEDVWIIGGEKLYSAFMSEYELNKLLKEVYVTEIVGDYGCDTFFRELNNSQYEEISCETVGEKLKFKTYRNKNWNI